MNRLRVVVSWILHREPVAVSGAVAAVTALAVGIQAHNVTEGAVTGAVTAVLALCARSQVTPMTPGQLLAATRIVPTTTNTIGASSVKVIDPAEVKQTP